MADDNPYLTRNERLAREFDLLVMQNKLREDCAADLVMLFGPKCVVKDDGVYLDDKPLKEAVEAIVAARPYTHPVDAVSPDVAARNDLETQALAGNLTAFGRLQKQLSAADFAAWQKKTGAVPGKPAVEVVKDDGTNKDAEKHAKTPWANTPANVDPKTGRYSARALTLQSNLVRGIGAEKSAEIAASVGAKLGSVRPAA